MIKNNKYCITFAGAVGSSKTPIANYISTKLNLPVFNNDAIRSEVIEDLGKFNHDEHKKRRDTRLNDTLTSGVSFICDLSVDREWMNFKKYFNKNGYDFFVISIDLSKELLVKLYKAKEYFESLERVDKLIEDHNVFLDSYSNDINLHISDDDFKDRCEISYKKVSEWIK